MRVFSLFRRRRNRAAVPRLHSRDETPENVSRVDLVELTPGLVEYLGQAAYVQLSLFETLSQAVLAAPSTADKESVARVASLALSKHEGLVEEIRRGGDDPSAVMEPYAQRLDEYRRVTLGADWQETMLTAYLAAGLLDDFFRRLSAGLPGDHADRVHAVLSAEDGHELLVAELRQAVDSDPRLGSRLAMWGRRLVGDTLLIARGVLVFEQTPKGEERIEPVFTELIAAHTRRMDGLGLTA